MQIYNSLSGKKEELIKHFFSPVKIFVCGPTVYDYAHLGHARTYVFFDSFVKYLRKARFKVRYLQNITDVDDKIIERAKEEKKKPVEIANFFATEYKKDMEALNVSEKIIYAPASKFIPQIVGQVQKLIKKGVAYKIDHDGYYFDISKFKDYGKLSKRTALQAEDAVSRIDENSKKINRGDFALWKFKKDDFEPSWDTPLGEGRPGWHIEDTAITEKFFGPQYDIHGGGIDLKFPHHEAEITQQESASGKVPFVKIWMHTGFLLVDGQKMSKSLKNFITIKDFLKNYEPSVLRWMVLSRHYRTPLNYSEELAKQAKSSLDSIRDFWGKMEMIRKKSRSSGSNSAKNIVLHFRKEFFGALEDDFNTPEALAAIFRMSSNYQERAWEMDKRSANFILEFLQESLETLGITLKTHKIPSSVQRLADERELLRANKQFVQSDVLRKKILELGYSLEDTPLGPWLKQV